MRLTASLRAIPGARLNDKVTDGKLSLMVHCERRRGRRVMGECAQRNHPAVSRANVDLFQSFRALPELRLHFHDNVVLIQLRVHRRYLPLPEGIVERVVDHLRRDAKSSCRRTIVYE